MPLPLSDRLGKELGIPAPRVEATLALFAEGATIPFITRYRKEVTGGLDETQLRTLEERANYLRSIDQRRTEVIEALKAAGKLTPEIEAALLRAETLSGIEDIYLPFRPKRRTRAQAAREAGLEGLANIIMSQAPVRGDRAAVAGPFVAPDKGVADIEAAFAGARDIIAETFAETPEVRETTRREMRRFGRVTSKKRLDADPEKKFETYHDFAGPVANLAPHKILAMNRGEDAEALRIAVEVDQERLLRGLETGRVKAAGFLADEMRLALADGLKRLVCPAIEREIRNELTERAAEHALEVFAENLRSLLLIAPLRGKNVLGVDPGFRTGSKLAVVEPTGRLKETGVIFLHQEAKARETVAAWIKKHAIDIVAIGNGTASRETEALVADVIRSLPAGHKKVVYTIVNEAGASVYSASPEAADEFPMLDATERGTISIARRLQDPLAELVKITPESIGVGLYQHDVDKKKLAERLEKVVVSCVNHVGVEVNTASAALLAHVAGLQKSTAKAIVQHREVAGPFRSRAAVLEVKGVGPKAFEQAAGFLRISDGAEPLDGTAVHPESYDAAKKLIAAYGDGNARKPDLPLVAENICEAIAAQKTSFDRLAAELGVGVPTLKDIVQAFVQPGRDPRDESPAPILRSDVLKLEDLSPGMTLKGTVRNVVDFGAFVDLGVKVDGLVHVSQMGHPRPKHPLDVLSVGDVIDVRVESIDSARGRIALALA